MGRAKLLTHLGNGLYSVEVDTGDELRTKRLAAIDKRLAAIAIELDELQVMLGEAQVALFDATAEADSAIVDLAILQGEGDATSEQLLAASDKASKAVEVAIKANEPVQKLRIDMLSLEADQAALNKEKAQLQNLPLKRTVEAWCADLTENATGDTATIEIPGEPTALLVAPGGRAPVPALDGKLLARAMMTPEQAFYNAAILPGWQRFKPDYRKGTVTFVDTENDTVNVLLDDAVSTAQSLTVMRKDAPLSLAAVPVQYLTCNAAAFDVNDRCVVQFEGRDWDNPKVIGFVDNPKPCLPEFVYLPIRAYRSAAWQVNGTYTAISGLGNGNLLCGDAVLAMALEEVMDATFEHTIEYRDGAFYSGDFPGLEVTTLPFVLKVYDQGVRDFTFPTLPNPDLWIASIGTPKSYQISLGSGGATITQRIYDTSGGAVSLPTAQAPPTATTLPPCSLYDYVSGVIHAARTNLADLLGYDMQSETLINTSDGAVAGAFFGNGPDTVTVRRGERTWVYGEPEWVFDPTLSVRAVIRYKRPEA